LKNLILSILKIATSPLAILYGLVTWLRNLLYDKKISSSLNFSVPIINVGNLSMGGTGKTPHTEYLISILKDSYNICTLSRGYKRHSRGFIMADENADAKYIGDEPMQFKTNFPEINVCVSEDRILAVPQIMQLKPSTQVILLDDAFQHRSIAPSLNILITTAQKLYTNDYILPFGTLREFRSGAKRADIIIVSKCDAEMNEASKNKIVTELNILPHQHLFFTTIKYNNAYNLLTKESVSLQHQDIILVSGIANNSNLFSYLSIHTNSIHVLKFPDHYYYNSDDINDIIETYNNLSSTNKCIVTTQKDATRLLLHKQKLQEHNIVIAVLPIKISFLFNDEINFDKLILQHLLSYYPIIETTENYEIETIEQINKTEHETS
jgi:tetraacyldisaccharide 4'-kinase